MIDPADVNKLKALPEWQRLEEHIAECIDALDRCSDIEDDYAVTAKARKEAVRTLHKILEPFAYDPQPVANKRAESLRKLGLDDELSTM